jgi:predicted phage tail protein
LLCNAAGVCPAVQLSTAKYLTEEETVTEDGSVPTETTSDSQAQPDPTSPAQDAKLSAPLTNNANPSPTPQAGASPVNVAPQATSPSAEVTPVVAVATTPAIIFGSNTVIQDTNSAFVIAGQTLSAGGDAVILDGTTVALAAGGSSVVVNGVAQPVQSAEVQAQAPAPAQTPVLSLNDERITAGSGAAFVIAGQTLNPGGSIVVAGTTIALASGGGNAVINGVTQVLIPSQTPRVLDLSGQVLTANSESAFVIGGTTLTPGGSLLVSGTTISLDSTGSTAFINGVAQPLEAASTAASGSSLNVLTIDGQFISAQEVFVISGQTLAFDHPITIGSGATAKVLALTTDALGNTVLVSDGDSSTIGQENAARTSKSSSRPTTSTNNIGDQIATGIGLTSSATSGGTGSDVHDSGSAIFIIALLVIDMLILL